MNNLSETEKSFILIMIERVDESPFNFEYLAEDLDIDLDTFKDMKRELKNKLRN